jgi:hypothetical protein
MTHLGEIVDAEIDVDPRRSRFFVALAMAAGAKSTAVTVNPCLAREIALSPSPQP